MRIFTNHPQFRKCLSCVFRRHATTSIIVLILQCELMFDEISRYCRNTDIFISAYFGFIIQDMNVDLGEMWKVLIYPRYMRALYKSLHYSGKFGQIVKKYGGVSAP